MVAVAADPLHLTPRQREILALAIREGMTNRQIAEHLGINIGTVKAHLQACREAVEGLTGDIERDATSGRWLLRAAYALGRSEGR